MKIGFKTITQYVLLVGIPLLGVLGTLWIGADLVAPASVGGAWAIQSPQQASLACEAFATWNGETQMLISQSGSDLLIAFNDATHTKMTGQLSGLTIVAEKKAGSSSQPELQLLAEVDRQVEPTRLNGSLLAAGCANPLAITGERLPASDMTSQEH